MLHAVVRERAVLILGEVAASDTNDVQALGQETVDVEVVQSGQQLAVREITSSAEDDERHECDAPPCALTACPPNCCRSAARSRSANGLLSRDRKRVKSAAVRTGIGTLWASASPSVHRPSPESSTYASSFASPGSSASARAVSSSNHDRTTLPCIQSEATFARSMR